MGLVGGLFGDRELPTAVIAPMVFPYAHRQQDLYRILKAYTIYRPDEGYCQAQAPVAAMLLMHMPAEVSRRRTWSGRGRVCRGDGGAPCPVPLAPPLPPCSCPSQQAFWCLVQICDKYLPGYYSAGLVSVWRLVRLGLRFVPRTAAQAGPASPGALLAGCSGPSAELSIPPHGWDPTASTSPTPGGPHPGASSHGSSHLQEAIQLDGEIFFALLRRASPLAHRHLRRQRIDPVLYMTEWFMCIFARTLPWASVLRVWDMFFCEGTSVATQARRGTGVSMVAARVGPADGRLLH